MKNAKIKEWVIKSALLLPLTLAMSGCGSSAVNLNDYLTVSYKGYDSIGTASFSIDIEELLQDNAEAFGLENASYGSLLLAYDDLYGKIGGELDKTKELSNGDKITFKWDDIDEKRFKEKYSVKLNYSDVDFEVTGLDEVKEFNPFDYVKVTYEGFAPYGKLNISKDGDNPLSGISYRADKADGLSNGDKVLVTAEGYSDLRDYCIERGYIPVETEHVYTVNGLASYISKLEDVPSDVISKMDSHAQDVLKAHVAKEWSDSESFKGMTLIGNYFLIPKDSSISANTYNYIYFIYKVTAENMSSGGTFDYYYYSYYTDIVMLDDGTCSFDLNSIEVPEGSRYYGETFTVDRFYYTGYEDLDSLFNKHITSKIDKYQYESTVN